MTILRLIQSYLQQRAKTVRRKMVVDEEIERREQRLLETQNIPDSEQNRRFKELQTLARELGASTIRMYPGHGDAGEAELTDNIHRALQTASMIDMCKTSSRNYKIAIVAAIAAVLSALAAWVAVLISYNP